MKSYYHILGVSRYASAHEIRSAYQQLVRQHHPDRKQVDDRPCAANDDMMLINLAYETLKDPSKRQAYDKSLPIDFEALGQRMGRQVKDNLIALKDSLKSATKTKTDDATSHDLHVSLYAEVWQVALGHVVTLDTGYETLSIKLAPIVDTPLRVLGYGHPIPRQSGQRGDLYVTVYLKSPPISQLSATQRQAYELLAAADNTQDYQPK